MQPRRWFGLVLVFVFLPVNVPLLQMLVELPVSDSSYVRLVILLFIVGLLLLFFPTRSEVSERVRARSGTDDE